MSIAGPRPSRHYVEREALTRVPATPAVPGAGGAQLRTSNQAGGKNDPGQGTATPGDGLVLAGLMAIVVSLYPWSGQTLSGGGNLLCWIFNTYQGVWTRCDGLDIDLSTTSGYPAYTQVPFKDPSRLGELILWATSAVTVSGGSDVLVRIDGFESVLGMSS